MTIQNITTIILETFKTFLHPLGRVAVTICESCKGSKNTFKNNLKIMKTISINLYSFNELSEEAKQKAVKNAPVFTDFIYDEAYETVKKACKLFGISEGLNSWLDFSSNGIDENILNLRGLRLRKWILNNFWDTLYKRKFYDSIGDNKIIKHPCIKVYKFDINKGARVSSSNFYYSRIQKTNDSVLTGVSYDNDFLNPIYEFIEWKLRPDYNTYQDWESLLNDCFESLRLSIENEVQYRNSFEAIAEDLQANEYQFTEEGEIYN
jgi:hypothetical protein